MPVPAEYSSLWQTLLKWTSLRCWLQVKLTMMWFTSINLASSFRSHTTTLTNSRQKKLNQDQLTDVYLQPPRLYLSSCHFTSLALLSSELNQNSSISIENRWNKKVCVEYLFFTTGRECIFAHSPRSHWLGPFLLAGGLVGRILSLCWQVWLSMQKQTRLLLHLTTFISLLKKVGVLADAFATQAQACGFCGREGKMVHWLCGIFMNIFELRFLAW